MSWLKKWALLCCVMYLLSGCFVSLVLFKILLNNISIFGTMFFFIVDYSFIVFLSCVFFLWLCKAKSEQPNVVL